MSSANRIITVFGSSRPHPGDAEYAEAHRLGAELGARGFTVCSGGYGGVMEAVSRGAKEAGGRTLGITAEFFSAEPNRWVDERIHVSTWQERLFELIARGEGYVACRGGTGTLVELAVVWEMLNKSVISCKPLVVLGDFWLPILDRVREVERSHASRWGEANGDLVRAARDAGDAAGILAEHFAKSVKGSG